MLFRFLLDNTVYLIFKKIVWYRTLILGREPLWMYNVRLNKMGLLKKKSNFSQQRKQM